MIVKELNLNYLMLFMSHAAPHTVLQALPFIKTWLGGEKCLVLCRQNRVTQIVRALERFSFKAQLAKLSTAKKSTNPIPQLNYQARQL